jgi:hypothetical protein
MKFTRRVARLEQQVKEDIADGAPTCFVHLPSNGRDDTPPGRTSFRSGAGVVVIYDPDCPPKEASDTSPG